VDPGTHVLASLALARGFFPRWPWSFLLAVVLAGTLADIDLLTVLFGPSAYLSGRNTWTHSIAGVLVIAAICSLIGISLRSRKTVLQKPGSAPTTFPAIFFATCLAATVHVCMDLATSSGISVLWPFRPTRFACDILPATDPWILSLLVAGLVLPELFRLVGSEIGAKDKAPRGRNGALIALAFACLYIGTRVTLHGDAVAQLDAHSYRGETPRRIAALPDSLTIFTWHGIVETASQICMPEVPATVGVRFDPETAFCIHKPEPSPALTAAQHTEAAQKFLAATRFPKASVEVDPWGKETQVILRNMAVAKDPSRYDLSVQVAFDPSDRVMSQRIVWALSNTITVH
jgi:membrane-bound metal-dependent hydrolase YbcI (DUF457 family)